MLCNYATESRVLGSNVLASLETSHGSAQPWRFSGAMLRLACAFGALQTVADAFPAIPLVPRVRCAPQTPVASMRPTRIAAFAVAGEPGGDVQEGVWSRPLVLVSLVIGAISLRDSRRGQEDSEAWPGGF